jgi:hypothetical protein
VIIAVCIFIYLYLYTLSSKGSYINYAMKN